MFWKHWFGLSPTSGSDCSDSDSTVGSKELAAAADVILTTHENLKVSLIIEWSQDTVNNESLEWLKFGKLIKSAKLSFANLLQDHKTFY